MYNVPVPFIVINQIEEERKARAKVARIGDKVFENDNPGGLMFVLNNLAKSWRENNNKTEETLKKKN
jgi:uncharacterized protein YutD